LSGEVCITKGAFAEAAPFLARLSLIEEAPKQQRLMSGIAAVDLYENKLGDPGKALEVLVGLHRAGLSNPAVRERLARVAARAAAKPQIALDARALAEIADPHDSGPVAELFVAFAETISVALGPSLSSLGVTKKDKVEARGGNPLRFAIAEWVGAVGIASDWD